MNLEVAEVIADDFVDHVLPYANLETSQNNGEDDTEHYRSDGDNATSLVPPYVAPSKLEHYFTFLMLALVKKLSGIGVVKST